jgi:hypothetical protein
MYLPLELNTPDSGRRISFALLEQALRKIGGSAGKTIRERGVIIASGLMAGGALGRRLGAAFRLLPRISRGSDQDAFLLERCRYRNRFRAAVCWLVSVCMVRLAEESISRKEN